MSFLKFSVYKEQVSNDGGVTWIDTSPLVTAPSGDPLGTYDTLSACTGDTPPTPTGYSSQYLTFRALEDCEFRFRPAEENNVLSYSLDSGATWTELASGASTPIIHRGSTVMWKGITTPTSKGIGYFRSLDRFNVEGNIMSLLYGDDFVGETSLSGFEEGSVFARLFCDPDYGACNGLRSAENLVLPATALTDYCYEFMFYSCTSLTTAPQLLPATTLAEGCYCRMFQNCGSLTSAPALPATTLSLYCYLSMFECCASLTSAPVLPATTLVERCYEYMFSGCTSLITVPLIAAETLATFSCWQMFCNCSNLAEITCLATDISAHYCVNEWVYGVNSPGTFYKNPSMTSWPRATNDNDYAGIPRYWTVVDYTG